MNVYVSIRRNLQFFGALGESQVVITSNSSDITRYEITWRRILYSVFILCVIACVITPFEFYLNLRPDEWPKYQLAQKVVNIYDNICSPFGVCLSIISSIWYSKSTRTAVSDLTCTIKSLERISKVVPFSSAGKYMAAHIVFFTLFISTDLLEIGAELNGKPFPWGLYLEYVNIWYFLTMGTQFGVYILAISSAFSVMKKDLSKCLENSMYYTEFKNLVGPEDIGMRKSRFTQPEIYIRQYKIIYHDLYAVSLKFNQIFSTVNLWVLVHSAMFTINSTYRILVAFQSLTSNHQLPRLLWDFALWSGYGFFIISMLVYPCEKASKQSAAVGRMVNKFSVRCADPIITKELAKFSGLIQQEKIKFSPHGICTLNNSIVVTILGAVVSYLAILTQLPNSWRTLNCSEL